MAKLTEKQIEQEFASEKERQLALDKVKLFIPRDPVNPINYRWVCVNGVEYYLAVGKQIEVPNIVADVWNESYQSTMEAYEKINTETEI